MKSQKPDLTALGTVQGIWARRDSGLCFSQGVSPRGLDSKGPKALLTRGTKTDL